jgi:hypothetical protein
MDTQNRFSISFPFPAMTYIISACRFPDNAGSPKIYRNQK